MVTDAIWFAVGVLTVMGAGAGLVVWLMFENSPQRASVRTGLAFAFMGLTFLIAAGA